MTDYRCQYCGGHINPRTMKCEYCDTQYKLEADDLIPIMYVEKTSIVPIVATAGISMRDVTYIGKNRANQLMKSRLSNIMIDKIMEKVDIIVECDPIREVCRYRAILKIEDKQERCVFKEVINGEN